MRITRCLDNSFDKAPILQCSLKLKQHWAVNDIYNTLFYTHVYLPTVFNAE